MMEVHGNACWNRDWVPAPAEPVCSTVAVTETTMHLRAVVPFFLFCSGAMLFLVLILVALTPEPLYGGVQNINFITFKMLNVEFFLITDNDLLVNVSKRKTLKSWGVVISAGK